MASAVQRALAELDIAPGELSPDQYSVTVLVQPERGFLGVDGTDALVEVRLLEPGVSMRPPSPSRERWQEGMPDEESDDGADLDLQPEAGSARLREFLSTVLALLGVQGAIRIIEKADLITADISGEELGVLIGKRGQTIDALEFLANMVLYPDPRARKAVSLDAQGYKRRRQASIERLAYQKAEEAVRKGRPVQLQPMTAAERKIVHLALKDWSEVTTQSEGREPDRAVVIRPVR